MTRRLQALRERDRRAIDIAVALVLLVAVLLNVGLTEDLDGPLWANLIVYGAMALALVWRRTQPLASSLGVVALGILGQSVLTGPPSISVSVMIVIVAAYSVGANAEPDQAFVGLVAGAIGIEAITLVDTPSDFWFPVTFFWIAPWFGGRVMRSHTRLARELAERADRAEQDRELEEARAVAEERRRVARELHDVLAHDLSVMVVQSGAARRVLAADPERAVDAARLVERTGREALAELRHLFGPLRRGEGEPLDGSPSVARVDKLADRARDAGLAVDLRIEGEPRPLPPGVDLAGYRVVQEALTNTLKHAGPACATVTVSYLEGELVLEITDDGAGPTAREPAVPGSGHGLVGMRERVALYGGELETGRGKAGGYAVRAQLPINGGGT